MNRNVLIRLLLLIAVVSPISLFAQGGRGGGRAADSIKYVYTGTPQLEKLKTEAAALVLFGALAFLAGNFVGDRANSIRAVIVIAASFPLYLAVKRLLRSQTQAGRS